MCNILDHRKIKMIRKGPEGNTVVLLWLLMLTESGKSNRGGYLMVTDNLPYSEETLAMVTDIPLATVQLALSIFTGFKMIDRRDGAIFIMNWGKYQSEDKLEARRESDRLRKQRQRQREREKLLLPEWNGKSRDNHTSLSRDVTQQNRENIREEKTTEVRMLLTGTPFNGLSDSEILVLHKRHGRNRLLLAADIAAQTWQQDQNKKIGNPGGYLQSLCHSHENPAWYQPSEICKFIEAPNNERIPAPLLKERGKEDLAGEEEMRGKNVHWSSLSPAEQESYCSEALASMPPGFSWPKAAVDALAKDIAWKRCS